MSQVPREILEELCEAADEWSRKCGISDRHEKALARYRNAKVVNQKVGKLLDVVCKCTKPDRFSHECDCCNRMFCAAVDIINSKENK